MKTTTETAGPTNINLFVLGQIFSAGVEVPNSLSATKITHMERCEALGLCVHVDLVTIRLTDRGIAALDAFARAA